MEGGAPVIVLWFSFVFSFFFGGGEASLRDLLLEGLDVLDYLQVSGSTGFVSSVLSCDQSSVSRIYRFVSSKLDLGFAKQGHLQYAPTKNEDLLLDLRSVAQRLRLRSNSTIRIVGQYWNEALLADMDGCVVLSRQWFGLEEVLVALRQRLVDVAVVSSMDLGLNDLLRRPTARRRWLVEDLAGTTLARFPLRPLVHRSHPLAHLPAVSAEMLWDYPSLARDDQQFPVLSEALKQRGLWQDNVLDDRYRLRTWEGRCRDCRTIAYHTPLIAASLPRELPLMPLDLDLALMDHEVILCMADVAEEPSIKTLIAKTEAAYQGLAKQLDAVELCHAA
jgi:hypothetical protein